MTKRARNILFLSLLGLFIVAAPVLALYSQGYRFDFNTKRIIQVGGVFLEISPNQAEIFLDEKKKKNTGLLNKSALIENMLPGTYKIEVKKQGYRTWTKQVEVKEKEVSKFENVILFPEILNMEMLSLNVERIWMSPDERNIIIKENGKESWTLKFYEINKKTTNSLISEDDISLKGANLLDLTFSEDSNEITLKTGGTEKVTYYRINLDNAELEKMPEPEKTGIIAETKANNDIYYLSSSGYIFKNKERVLNNSFPVKEDAEYSIKSTPTHIFIKEGKALYRLNPDSEEFELISNNSKNEIFSPDQNKIAFFSDHEIWIMFLEKSWLHEEGEKILISRLSGKITGCSWINSSHLAVATDESIKVSEIDTRDKPNITDLKEIKSPEIFWNSREKTMYVLSENTLYSLSGILR